MRQVNVDATNHWLCSCAISLSWNFVRRDSIIILQFFPFSFGVLNPFYKDQQPTAKYISTNLIDSSKKYILQYHTLFSVFWAIMQSQLDMYCHNLNCKNSFLWPRTTFSRWIQKRKKKNDFGAGFAVWEAITEFRKHYPSIFRHKQHKVQTYR